MLVLTRKVGEAILLGEDVRVTVLSVSRRYVRLSIVAPPSVRVDREEFAVRRARRPAPSDRRDGTTRGTGFS